MHKLTEHIEDGIRKTLRSTPEVEFAVLFGSAARGEQTAMSDIDVGVYFREKVSLILMGSIVAALEVKLQGNVDLVELNDLYKTRPTLAYEIITVGKLVLCSDKAAFVDFKRKVFLYYLDTKPLREMVNMALTRRIASGSFGRRNYVESA